VVLKTRIIEFESTVHCFRRMQQLLDCKKGI